VIGHAYGLAKVTLWEEVIGKLSMSKNCYFEKMVIEEYRGEAYLPTNANTVMITIEGLDMIMTGHGAEQKMLTFKIENAMIIGVLSFENV